jgi:hypothetical protein
MYLYGKTALYLYKVLNANKVGYDDWVGFVVAAYNEEDALKVIEEEHPSLEGLPSINWVVTLIGNALTDRGVILDSFNAG